MMQAGHYDVLERQREKQRMRDQDDRDLRNGVVSMDELAQQNGFFDSLPIRSARIGRRGSVAI
ncbi:MULTISPECIES: hypothetical protein [Sphingobium]|uniref:hypothetical protein n=1 Tax=Sphingobium TaxID=165695 RepID=UPI001BED2AB4|nr:MULTISPECIES: hypothetical protein [Sphingobium]MBT2246088.1 hypothetical protein [Sphingobium sp. BHU LFT2]WBQ19032.1 hypothetical protein PAE53_24670 [Sphingobium yanoikuyae]